MSKPTRKTTKRLSEWLLSILVISLGLYQVTSVLNIGGNAKSAVDNLRANYAIGRICNQPAYSQGYVSQARHNQQIQAYLATHQSSNQIFNPKIALADPESPNLPQGWSFVPYGNLTATGTYQPGPQATATIKVQAANADSGASWAPQNVSVKGGSYFIYSDWYKADVPTIIGLQTVHEDGQVTNDVIARLAPSADWKQATAEVFVPAHVKSINVTHIINQLGELSTRNFVLAPGQAPGFDQGVVTITFDDGWAGIYETAAPLLKQNGLRSTQYIVSDYIGYTKYMDQSMLKQMMDDGNEIASHSTRHADQATLTANKLHDSLARSRVILRQLGVPVTSFASPYGSTSEATLSQISRCYLAQRGTDSGFNSQLYDVYQLKTQNIDATTTQAQLDQWLATAKQTNTWLILVYHDVDDSATSGFTLNKATLEKQFQTIKASGLRNLTMQQALESTSKAINQ